MAKRFVTLHDALPICLSTDSKTLEGYFDNLSAAATNEKGILNQLVLNKTTLAASNESLVALVKNHQNEIKNLER